MPTLTMLVGLPGSGKSTHRQNYIIQNPDCVVVSSDDFIESAAKAEGLTYSDVFTRHANNADKNCRKVFAEALAKGQDILIDRTNLTRKGRGSFLASVPKTYRVMAEVFIVGDKTLQDRLDKRQFATGNGIAQAVINSMRDTYQEPTLDEGFCSIHIHRTLDRLTGWGYQAANLKPTTTEVLRPRPELITDDEGFLEFIAETWGTYDTIEDMPGAMTRLFDLAVEGAAARRAASI